MNFPVEATKCRPDERFGRVVQAEAPALARLQLVVEPFDEALVAVEVTTGVRAIQDIFQV